ncbi:MAG: A/G-specific adenine glycosylase [Clostridiales bacterium]|nr:A/G-specific adenine glycosylase [Clostridiales bacterium]
MPYFSEKLLRWYDEEGRELPWRGTRDPYRIWLSEIMLQQTRTEVVADYYLRFLKAFPTVRALARAKQDDVLKLWEGLGYYSRARNLHAAARVVADALNGEFPQTAEELRMLPGIGPYTANAIASIAFDACLPALDGNQARVLARVLAWDRPLDTPFDLYEQAMERMPQDRPGDYNQALMDLSATVCLPKAPRCGACPVSDACRACRNGKQLAYPVRREKPPRRIEERTVLLLLSPEGMAYERRPASGLLAGLMQFPNLEGHLSAEEVRAWLDSEGISCEPGSVTPLPPAKHTFTHLVWQMTGYAARLEEAPGRFRYAKSTAQLAFPSAFRVYRQIAEQLLSGAYTAKTHADS